MALSAGSQLGVYRIVGPLGAGGMGEVYRAHDPRLARDVALKVLPADMAGDPSRLERFTREARAIAALNHPHIVTIYSTEEADGLRFLTMELVEGHSLDALIPPTGLPLARFLELALPLADALTAAHQKQITHRDLKPGNVMVAGDGRVKVLDFGLARVSGPLPSQQTIEATRAVLTSEGTIVGTMPYMSPEQIEGRPLDQRTDLFSLGVMFHEMLTGARPFGGESSPQLMSSILRDTPSSASDIRADVPDTLSRLIHRCLEKRPDDRVQTARDIYNELKHVQKQLESGSARAKADSGSGRVVAAESAWIAVLPFTTRTADPDGQALASGLTEDITSGLSLFPSLSVVALHTARSFKDSPLDARQIAERLNARYIMGGSVRKSASGVRVAVHLIDAHSGTQLWSDTYDHGAAQADIYAVQDDVTDRVVATVADKAGVLARSIAQATQGIPVDRLSAHQLVHRCWGFEARPTPAEHAELRGALEAVVDRPPHHAELWAELANIYLAEHCLLYNPLPDCLGRALRASRRAIEIDRTNQRGWVVLASACFFNRDEPGFTEAADRVLKLNPRNSNALAWMGTLTAHMGQYDRGCALVDRAMALNSAHPGWYHFAHFNREVARRDFQAALRSARRVNIPDFMWMHLAIAAAAGQLGLAADGRVAVETMDALVPPLADEARLREFLTRWFWDDQVVEDMVAGVRRSRSGSAGSSSSAHVTPTSTSSPSGFANAGTVPSAASAMAKDAGALAIAVRLFGSRGGDTAVELAEGLTEDVTTGLARFSTLRVVPRTSETVTPVPARYVLEGQVRLAQAAVRVSARLTDTMSGAHLWAENYDRPADSGVFALQDDIAPRIIATVGDANGVLLRSMVATLKQRPIEEHTVRDLVLRFHGFLEHFDSAEHQQLRDRLVEALRQEPGHADGWACLSSLIEHEYSHGLNPLPDPLGRARQAAERSVAADPVCQEGWRGMASAAFFARDAAGVRIAAERAIAINPLNTGTVAVCGVFLAYSGAWDRGLDVIRQAMQPNPHYPGWVHFPFCSYHFQRGDYTIALQHVKQVNMPRFPKWHLTIAAVAGQMGLRDEARAALDALSRLDPASGDDEYARRAFASWTWTDDEMERLIDGVRKARALVASGDSKPLPASAPALSDTIPRGAVPSGPSAGTGPHTSIAVLPFTDLSEEKNQDWFCDGIAEEILNALTQLPGLHVAARTSAFSLRDTGADLQAIAEKLAVATVVQGSVRRAGDRIRVTVQLVDVSNGFQLWSERYDRELKDIFDVQDEIARAIAGRLKVTLASDGQRLVPQLTTNLEAYELLLRGRTLQARRGRAILDALQCFERAVRLDPDLAEAQALLGDAYRLLGLYGIAPAAEMMPLARAAVERALALDSTQVEALATLANIAAIYDWDIRAAAALSDRALGSDPSHVRALAERAVILTSVESIPADVEQRVIHSVRRARELDPLSAWVWAIESYCLALTYRPAEAAVAVRRAVTLDPENFTARWVQVWTLAASGDLDEAVAAAEPALQMSARHPRILTELAAICSERGDQPGAQTIYDELRTRAATSFIGSAEQAAAAAAAGHLDEARRLAVLAIEARDTYLAFWKLPGWAPFRRDPESMALLRQAGITDLRHRDQ